LQSSPILKSSTILDSSSARQSQQLAKRLLATIKQQNKSVSLRVTQKELLGLSALMHRAIPDANANVNLSKFGALFELSIGLPLPDIIKYLNVSLIILPSSKGLDIDQLIIGDLTISGKWLILLVKWSTNTFIQEELGDQVFNVITSVSMSNTTLQVNAMMSSDLLASKNKSSILFRLRDKLALFGNIETVEFYFDALNTFAQQQDKNVSIALFLQHLFEKASLRCDVDPECMTEDENQAALIALVVYFGADKFQLMVGDLLDIPHEQLVIRNKLRAGVTLQGRNDLQQHLIYSIALQIFSSYGASDAIGEFKEFLDSNTGGSGFSFADLMADRAGTRLAMIATQSGARASDAQRLLGIVTDEQLLPKIVGLQEGLSEKNFKDNFNNVNSKSYQQTLQEIDNRLKQLPIYKLGWE